MQPLHRESHRWLVASSWSLAAFYCAVSFLVGRLNSAMADIYADMGVRFHGPRALLPYLRLPVTLTAGVLIAIALIVKNRRMSPSSATRCNHAAAIILLCFSGFCVITAFWPVWGPHELITK